MQAQPSTPLLNKKLPLWYQVEQSLRAEIMARRYAESGRLPTEIDLAQRFGVSLITVRQALKSLEEEGIISRHRRRGTFVRPEVYRQSELKVLGTIETVFSQQESEQTEVLEEATVAPPPQLEPLFAPLTEVRMFRRLRREHGAPLSYVINYVVPQYGARIRGADLAVAPMTKVLRDKAGAKIKRIHDTVEAQLATPEIARLLDVAVLSPVLFVMGHTYDARDRLIDVACIHYRADRYKFSVAIDFTS